MLRNYITSTLRNLVKNKTYALINVFGLALGLSCCITIFLIIKTELSFDTFHENSDRIYRVVSEEESSEGKLYFAASHFPLAASMRNDFPDFEHVVATRNDDEIDISILDSKTNNVLQSFKQDGVGFSQTAFFEVFGFKIVQGNPETCLDEPKTAVISQTTAQKYFGDESPIGRSISMDNNVDVTITGVFEDFPENTDFPFNSVIASWETLRTYDDFIDLDKWNVRMSSVQTFVLLPNASSPERFEKLFPDFSKKYLGEDNKDLTQYSLQPLNEIHFDERYGNYEEETVSTGTLNALGLIGLFLIITACINFVNLSTALATKRSKEVGIRKVLGTTKGQITIQFLLETLLILTIALILALGLTELILLNIQKYIEFNAPLKLELSLEIVGFLTGLLVFAGLLSGIYPAVIMAGYTPAEALKGKLSNSKASGVGLRKILVIVQFTISQILIVGTLVVTEQISMFNNKDLGLNKESVVTVGLPNHDPQKLELLRNKISSNPLISNVSFSIGPAIGEGDLHTGFEYKKMGDEEISVSLKFADENYIDLYKIELLAGRQITNYDTLRNVIVNESLIKKINISTPEEAIGEKISVFGGESTIVGVVKDFHTVSLKSEIPACLIASYSDWYFYANVKVSPQNLTGSVAHIEEVWGEVFPKDIIDYVFLDDTVATFYEDEQRISKLFIIFSLIAIFISCMGLFGLITFMASQKTKEVGIRKVLGASIPSIIFLFSKQFVKLILVALVIASPIAYYFMNEWLDEFAYRIDINPMLFLVVGVITITITGATVGYKSLSAALANPVHSLKDE